MSSHTVRLSGTVLDQAQGAVDPYLGINGTVAVLIREIIAGSIRRPYSPMNFGPKDARLNLRINDDVWVNQVSRVVDERFPDSTSRNDLVRDLIYALAEGRISVDIRITRREGFGDRND